MALGSSNGVWQKQQLHSLHSTKQQLVALD
jgi:hypothetical protein